MDRLIFLFIIFTSLLSKATYIDSVEIINIPLPVMQSSDWTISSITDPVAISGDISISNFPSVQAVSQSGLWTTTSNIGTTGGLALDSSVGLLLKPSDTLAAITNIGSVTSITNPVSVTGTFFQATQPVSLASLPLPSGASTSANQVTANASLSSIDSKLTGPISVSGSLGRSWNLSSGSDSVTANLGTIGGAATETTLSSINTKLPSGLTVTGSRLQVELPSGSGGLTDAELRASPVPISGSVTSTVSGSVAVTGPLTDAQLRASAVPVSLSSTTISNFPATQAVSAASLPLPSGASTSALQTTGNSSLSSIDGKLNSLGQKVSASSVPVVVASDQVLSVAESKSSAATLSSVSNSNATQVLLASNANRKGAYVHNDSNTTCYYAFAATATATAFTFRLTSQQSYIMPFPIYTGTISFICGANNGSTRNSEL